MDRDDWDILKEYENHQKALSTEILICECYGIPNTEIKNALAHNPRLSFEEVCESLRVSHGCGSCKELASFWFKQYKELNTTRG